MNTVTPCRKRNGTSCLTPSSAPTIYMNDPEDEPLPERMEVHYDVEGSARKALAHAIGEGIGAYPSYKAAPSFTYTIGDYTLDRHGVLTGPHDTNLLGLLAQDGYQTK